MYLIDDNLKFFWFVWFSKGLDQKKLARQSIILIKTFLGLKKVYWEKSLETKVSQLKPKKNPDHKHFYQACVTRE
jgi:hypothetical protein